MKKMIYCNKKYIVTGCNDFLIRTYKTSPEEPGKVDIKNTMINPQSITYDGHNYFASSSHRIYSSSDLSVWNIELELEAIDDLVILDFIYDEDVYIITTTNGVYYFNHISDVSEYNLSSIKRISEDKDSLIFPYANGDISDIRKVFYDSHDKIMVAINDFIIYTAKRGEEWKQIKIDSPFRNSNNIVKIYNEEKSVQYAIPSADHVTIFNPIALNYKDHYYNDIKHCLNKCTSIVHFNGRYYVFGSKSTIFCSNDLDKWIGYRMVDCDPEVDIDYARVTSDGYMTIISNDCRIYKSKNGVNWDAVTLSSIIRMV